MLLLGHEKFSIIRKLRKNRKKGIYSIQLGNYPRKCDIKMCMLQGYLCSEVRSWSYIIYVMNKLIILFSLYLCSFVLYPSCRCPVRQRTWGNWKQNEIATWPSGDSSSVIRTRARGYASGMFFPWMTLLSYYKNPRIRPT